MEDLKRMAVFTAVVQHGSMSGAARALGMSTSAVSQQVRKLESDGGVTLLHRSTRKLALTEAGQRYHARCAAMWAAAEQARAELAASRDAPSGELRMSATVGFARHIAPALGELLAAHPTLRLRLLRLCRLRGGVRLGCGVRRRGRRLLPLERRLAAGGVVEGAELI